MPDDNEVDHGLEAQRLLEIWERLARTHMMAGGGCACGVGGVVVALEDFEQDIADYVVAETEKNDRADVLSAMESHGREGEMWSIPVLLSSIAREGDGIEPSAASFILARLGRTLQSFEKLHGGT